MCVLFVFYVIGNQWKLVDAWDFVSYGNRDTHTSDNRLLVEEQEESSHSEWLGDFQHIAPKRVCVFVHFDTNPRAETSPAHRLVHRYTNRCKSVVICHNGYCLWVFTHWYHWFPNEAGTKTGQEMLCNDMCPYTREHLAHNNILCILSGINNNTAAAHSWADKVLTRTWGRSFRYRSLRKNILKKQWYDTDVKVLR